jgi:hypothetical protein
MANGLSDAELITMESWANSGSAGSWFLDESSGEHVRDASGELVAHCPGAPHHARIIVEAREAVPRLVAEVRRLRALLAEQHARPSSEEAPR